jgi:hypothetical protein
MSKSTLKQPGTQAEENRLCVVKAASGKSARQKFPQKYFRKSGKTAPLDYVYTG